MFQILFFIKTVFLTFVVVFLLQIKIGESTLEQKAFHFIQSSRILEPLRETSSHAVTFLRIQSRKVSSLFSTRINESWSASQIPGQRHLGLSLERSRQFLESQAEKQRLKEQELRHSNGELEY